MVNCFHSGVETFRRTLADKVKNNGAVHDGCSLAITKVNASKYNGIPNQMQTPHYSNEFQILKHPLHYHHEKNTSRRRLFSFFCVVCPCLTIWARTKKDK